MLLINVRPLKVTVQSCSPYNFPAFVFFVFLLVARLNGYSDPHRILEDPVVAEIAKKHKRSPAQVRLVVHKMPLNISTLVKSNE